MDTVDSQFEGLVL